MTLPLAFLPSSHARLSFIAVGIELARRRPVTIMPPQLYTSYMRACVRMKKKKRKSLCRCDACITQVEIEARNDGEKNINKTGILVSCGFERTTVKSGLWCRLIGRWNGCPRGVLFVSGFFALRGMSRPAGCFTREVYAFRRSEFCGFEGECRELCTSILVVGIRHVDLLT